MTRRPAYPPIADYALIGDAHTAALVGRDGAIDWLCWPHFDSPAVLCRLLDAGRGGWFRVGPAGPAESTRAYVPGTNVLVTTFRTAGGRVRVTDCMSIDTREHRAHGGQSGRGEDIAARGRILRLVECDDGEVELAVELRPTFDFARVAGEVTATPWGALARAGTETLTLDCPMKLVADDAGGIHGRATLRAGDRLWVSLTYGGERPTDPDAELAEALDYWHAWSARCRYEGPYHELVRRSALVLKLLTFEPTGAVVAAPTTSLPEELGGVRNWDYRFAWLRDSALILYALQAIGYHAEADDFFAWLTERCLACAPDSNAAMPPALGLQIMYRIDGGRDLPEEVLAHLEGYRRSAPVRVGNAAADQTQLDVYGEVLDAAFLHVTRAGPHGANAGDGAAPALTPELWSLLRHLADEAARRWREPDAGIWEVRGGPRHFLYSKLLCWVAVDRAARIADMLALPGDVTRWRATADEIRAVILEQGYDPALGAFTQALGEPTLDASALAIPLMGFLPPTDPRVRSTVARIRERLTSHGLVYRYSTAETDDGLPGGEATFALCSFWLVDALALGGQLDEARALFERVAGYANDVGLLAEEIDPATGELLGNFPQGFTHLALIRAALSIAKAERHGAEGRAETPAERADAAAEVAADAGGARHGAPVPGSGT